MHINQTGIPCRTKLLPLPCRRCQPRTSQEVSQSLFLRRLLSRQILPPRLYLRLPQTPSPPRQLHRHRTVLHPSQPPMRTDLKLHLVLLRRRNTSVLPAIAPLRLRGILLVTLVSIQANGITNARSLAAKLDVRGKTIFSSSEYTKRVKQCTGPNFILATEFIFHRAPGDLRL